MKKALLSFFSIFLAIQSMHAHMNHQFEVSDLWEVETEKPFDEMILSWNADRPQEGVYSFYVSVKVEDAWSDWLLYSRWGKDVQTSFKNSLNSFPARVYQDAVEILDGKKASAFRVKVNQDGKIYSLHAYTNGQKEKKKIAKESILLDVKGISQMRLNHPRADSLCSPVSTTSVVRYLLGSSNVDPTHFAHQVWDQGFDIFGNWVLNVVYAASLLGPDYSAWVERLGSFDEIYEHLREGFPVIVSIRGPISGSALPYKSGHLLVVKGYDPKNQKVICMDPAFGSDEKTEALYDLSEFGEAWARRGNIAYIFQKSR